MRIGVIGTGRIGQLHATILSALEGVESVVVSDIDESRARSIAADVDASVAPVDQVFDRVDAVVVAAATSVHADLIIAGVDAGLPVFCEKPIALDLPTTWRVVEHVEGVGGRVQIGFQRRFDAGYRAAHHLVRDGGLGTLYAARLAGHDPEPPHEAYIPASGGIFKDFSVHDFDALRFVTGEEIVEVYAVGDVRRFEVFARHGDVDTAAAILTLESGAPAILSVTRHHRYGYDVRMELFGSEDAVVVGWDERMPLRSIEPGGPDAPSDPYRGFQDRFRPAYQAEMEAFVRYAAEDGPSPCGVRDAARSMEVAEACERSRLEHRPVRVEEVVRR